MKLVIATHNRKKAGEMVTILGARFPNIEIVTLADYPGAPEPDETGTTYAENAMIKAESAAKFTGELCIADDAGLEINALDGAPGVYSKRFGGENLPFSEKMAMILDQIKNSEDRGARFRCCVAIVGQGKSEVMEAICEGVISETPSGNGGFGYDPIFFLPEMGCTMADLSSEQKHQVSHRGKVLKTAGDALVRIWGYEANP
jgi:XTP/dITP diphosphohydrolase